MTRTISSILGSDIVACWDSDDLSGVGDGNNVSSWVDSVGGYDMANGTTGEQPIWHADYLSSGYSAVKFDGTDDNLTVSNAALNLSSGWTTFLLLRRTTSTAVQTVISNYTSASAYCRIRDQDTQYSLQDAGGFLGATTYANDNDPAAVAVRYESGKCSFFTLADDSDKVEIPFVVTTTGTPFSSNTWYMGKRGDGTTQPYTGAISKCVIAQADIDTRTILECLTQMRYDAGITDSDSEPVEPAGGGLLRVGMGGGFNG